MYGITAYGQSAYGASASSAAGIMLSCEVTLFPEVSASAAHAIGLSAAIEIQTPVVQVGADQVERIATVVAEAGLSFSATSTIPVYAVGFAAPVVSVYSLAWTTVSGVASISAPVTTAIYGYQRIPIASDIVAEVRLSSTVYSSPVANSNIRPIVSVSGSGLVVTHGRGTVAIPTYVSSAAVTGFVGSVSAIIRSVFSAASTHSKAANAAVTVPVSIASTLKHGAGIASAVQPSVVLSAMVGAYSDIQISGAVEVPLCPYMRAVFGEDLSCADCAYVLTKQNAVSVLQ